MLRNGIIGRRRWNGFSDRAVRADLGAMATARSGHAPAAFLHAHAKPWAWHLATSDYS